MNISIGVDFDNTLVCYDEVFHRIAVEEGLVPPDLPVSKGKVRDYLRAVGREDSWTELQGLVYGARLNEAPMFSGADQFFLRCRQRDIPICIISHKTRLPFRGPAYDLHQAARDWLEQQGFHDPSGIALPREQVFLELTKGDKLRRIAAEGCTHFIDDLPEFLSEPAFPANAQRFLFDPNNHAPCCQGVVRVTSWSEFQDLIV